MVALGPARGTILVSYVVENNGNECKSDLIETAFSGPLEYTRVVK
jgi:hypothetical protein